MGAAIADGDGIVCIKDLADELGDPPGTGSVNTEFKVLERSGLLERVTRERGERRQFLVRQESAYWKFCQEARDTVVDRRGAGSRQRTGQRGGN